MTEAATDLQAATNAPVHFSGLASEAPKSPILRVARERCQREGLPFAGNVTPQEAWELFSQGEAFLVDVRTAEELSYVGRVPEALHVVWETGLSMSRNPHFANELENKTGKDEIVLLLCRSGKRSAAAAEAVTKAGFRNVFNVLEGFEGGLDDSQRRGSFNGWRYANLPWVQN